MDMTFVTADSLHLVETGLHSAASELNACAHRLRCLAEHARDLEPSETETLLRTSANVNNLRWLAEQQVQAMAPLLILAGEVAEQGEDSYVTQEAGEASF